MKLYKILKVRGDHGVSVFPPEDKELEPAEDLAGEPMSDLVNKLVIYGYPPETARHIINAWAYHAKYDLHQLPRGVRVFCEMCTKKLPVPVPPGPPLWHGFALLVAVLAALALGLYLWVTLDVEKDRTFSSHPWAYLMSYHERLWQGEILNVGTEQRAYYESGALFGPVVAEHQIIRQTVGGKDWFWLKPAQMTLQGRRLIFYHVYRLTGFYCEYCGVLTRFAETLFKLQEGGEDDFKPRGPWSRPGGRWGTPDYEGCWVEWWWF